MVERLVRRPPDALSEEQLAVYLKFAAGRRAHPDAGFSLVHPDGGLVGPPNAWLSSPPLGHGLEHLGGALRFELHLPAAAHELAILMVGVSRGSEFVITTHVPAGRSAGLSDTQIEAVLDSRRPGGLSEVETVVHETTSTILREHALDDGSYARAVEGLGERGLFELVTLIGYYELVATQLAVFGTAQEAVST